MLSIWSPARDIAPDTIVEHGAALPDFVKSSEVLRSCKSLWHFILIKAGERTRTVNLLLTRQLLYQLSYASK